MLEIADRLDLNEAAKECDLHVINSVTLERCLEVCHLSEIFLRFSVMQHAVRTWTLQRKKTQEKLIQQTILNDKIRIHDTDSGICLSCAEEILWTGQKTCMCYFKSKYHESDYIYIIGGYFWKQMNACYRIKPIDFFDPINANCTSEEYSINTKKPNDSDKPDASEKGDTATKDETKEVKKFETIQSFPGSYNEECRVVAIGTDVYVCGGMDDKSVALSEVWKYNTRLNEWERVSNMRHKR